MDIILLAEILELPNELLRIVINRLPFHTLLQLCYSRISRIRQAASHALHFIQHVENLEIQGRDQLRYFDNAVTPRIYPFAHPQLAITSIVLRAIQPTNRFDIPTVSTAIRRILNHPALQRIRFENIDMTRLVPTVTNQSLISITLDPEFTNDEYNLRLFMLCNANQDTLEELDLNTITDRVNALFMGGDNLVWYPNVHSLALRFNIQQGAVDLQRILDNLPLLANLDIENLGRRNTFNTGQRFARLYPQMRSLRAGTRDYDDGFFQLTRRMTGLQSITLHGSTGANSLDESVHMLYGVAMRLRNPTVETLQLEDHPGADRYIVQASLLFPMVRQVNLVRCNLESRLINLPHLELDRFEFDLSSLAPPLVMGTRIQIATNDGVNFLVFNGAAFEVANEFGGPCNIIIAVRQITALRLYGNGFDQLFT